MEIIIDFLKNLLIYFNDSNYFSKKEEKEIYEKICEKISEEQIYLAIEILLDAIKSSKNTNNTKLIFELAVIKIIESKKDKKIVEKEIPILQEKKKIVVEQVIEKKENSDDVKKNIENLKKIRINNTLSKFDKKELMTFKKDLDQIKELLMDPDYSSIVSIILDGELKAKGNKNLIFVYKLKKLEEYFNQSLIEIEQVFKKVFDEDIKPIAVFEEEWDPIKNEFNKNLKSNKNIYKYIEEENNLEDIYNIKKEEKIENKNEIEEIFEDMIEYN